MSGINNDTAALILIVIALSGFLLVSGSATPNQTTETNNFETLTFGEHTHMSYTGTNYAIINDNWFIGDPLIAPTILDTAVKHGASDSIRMEKGDGSKPREIWCKDTSQLDNWRHVVPGDHIFFSVWMKTNASTIGDATANAGIRLGCDFYKMDGTFKRVTGIQSPDGSYWTVAGGFPANQVDNFVVWNTAAFTLRTMDFIIPAQYPADPYAGYAAGTMVDVDHIIPWIQVWSDTNGNLDDGTAWFSDAILYVNPVDETPLITPTFSVFALSDTSVLTDEPVNCNVTLTGSSGDPTGTVTFYTSNDAGATWVQYGVPMALAVGVAGSIDYYPGLAGTYLFKAVYSGDSTYTAYSSANTSLSVTNPVVVTTPPMLGLLGSVLTQMEGYSGIETVSANVSAPGMDVIKSPFKTVIGQAESIVIETVSANVSAPGMDIITSPFKTIMGKMVNQI